MVVEEEDTAVVISMVTWIITTVILTTATAGAATGEVEQGRGLLMKGAGHPRQGEEARYKILRVVLGQPLTKFTLPSSILSQDWSTW